MKPAPAFQCYAGNIIADKRYRLMTPIERSVWVSIYFECWPNRAVPANPVELAKYLGYQVEEVKEGLTTRVLSFFKEVKGELICPELDEYRETLRLRNLMKSEGGKKGAERKRDIASGGSSNVEGTPRGTPKVKWSTDSGHRVKAVNCQNEVNNDNRKTNETEVHRGI